MDYPYATYEPSAYANGPIQLGFPPFDVKSSDGFVDAVSVIGVFPAKDLATGHNVGVKKLPFMIDTSYQRSSSYNNYYQQAVNRSNLDVLVWTPAQKIIFSQQNSSLVATGVTVSNEPTGEVYNITANKEVILSAGAHHSPQLLMLSVSRKSCCTHTSPPGSSLTCVASMQGIGPKDQLAHVGIEVLYENENVGQKYDDRTTHSSTSSSH